MIPDIFPLLIESLAYGGCGIGRRQDGKVVFVPHSAPGDKVQVQIVADHSSYATSRLEKIIEPSSFRVSPLCVHFERCGGCDWQHLAYDTQLSWKQSILANALRKVTPEDATEIMRAPVGASDPYAYRCHTRLQYRPDPNPSVGYFAKHTHTVFNCSPCPVLNPLLQQTLIDLDNFVGQTPIKGIHAFELYTPQEELFLVVHGSSRLGASTMATIKRLAHALNASGCVLAFDSGTRPVMGDDLFTYTIKTSGRAYSLSGQLGGFIQANLEMNTRMVEHAMDLCVPAQSILDLYAGAGNFGIPLADIGNRVTCVERDKRLASLGQANAARNDIAAIRFLCSDARQSLATFRSGEFDTIVLDPPRQGAKDIMPLISALGPARVVYVSCNPTTLARDLKHLTHAGYVVKSIRLFDMFPQTYHIECIVSLERPPVTAG